MQDNVDIKKEQPITEEIPVKKGKKKEKQPRQPLNKKRVATFLCVVGCTFALVALFGYIFVQKLVKEEDDTADYDFKEVKIDTPIINENVEQEDDNWFMNALDETAKPVTQKTEEAEAAAKKVETKPAVAQTNNNAATSASTAENAASATSSGENTEVSGSPSASDAPAENHTSPAATPKPENTTPAPAPKETPSTTTTTPSVPKETTTKSGE